MATNKDLSQTVKSLQNDVQKLAVALNEHVGNVGEEVHDLAYEGQAGFIDHDLYMQAYRRFKTRTVLDNGTDIGELEPGSYVGQQLVGVPPEDYDKFDGLMIVDVLPYGGGKRIIKLTVAFSTRTFYKTYHTNGASSQWHELSSKRLAWSGSMTSGTANYLLEVDQYPLRYLTVMGVTPSNNSFSETFPFRGQTNNVTINRSNSYKAEQGVGITSYELNISFNNRSLSMLDTLAIDQHNGTSSEVTGDPRQWYINRILVE